MNMNLLVAACIVVPWFIGFVVISEFVWDIISKFINWILGKIFKQ